MRIAEAFGHGKRRTTRGTKGWKSEQCPKLNGQVIHQGGITAVAAWLLLVLSRSTLCEISLSEVKAMEHHKGIGVQLAGLNCLEKTLG